MNNDRRIKNFYMLAQNEYEIFIKSDDKDLASDHLAEAGEKLWNIYNMLVEKITKRKIRNERMLKKALEDYFIKTNNDSLLLIYNDAYELHKYFYRGHGNTYDENDIYNRVNTVINKLIKIYTV